MTPNVDTFDLASLHLNSGEGRQLTLGFTLPPLELGNETYTVSAVPNPGSGGEADRPGEAVIECRLDVSRTTRSSGYVLRLRFSAMVEGPCMRCLTDARPSFSVDASEVSQPGESDEELRSPYVSDDGVLELGAWGRDAFALALPPAILCRTECAGLCAVCGADLNAAGDEHRHEREPDARWAKLAEIRFE